MLHRLCGPPSIPLSFSLATVLPRRGTYCVSSGTEMITTPTPSTHRLRRGLPGYLIPFAPTLSHLSVSVRPGGRLRHRRSSGSLRISPLHQEFRLPLRHSSLPVCDALPRLSRGLSRHTWHAAYAPFTPSNSEQRLPPPSYRGCWHGVSRGFLRRYRHTDWLFTTRLFVPADRALHPERRPHSRGVAASGSRPLRKIPHCCLP